MNRRDIARIDERRPHGACSCWWCSPATRRRKRDRLLSEHVNAEERREIADPTEDD